MRRCATIITADSIICGQAWFRSRWPKPRGFSIWVSEGRPAVERHEHFEALCAAASIGQASGADLAELQEHLGGCPDCQQAYADFLQLGAVRAVADANSTEEITGPEAIGYIDSALFREKFLKKAEAEGILVSGERVGSTLP